MTTDVLSVAPETTLKDVARLLGARGISGLPVVDAEGRVVGVVSEADILAKERRPAEHDGRHGLHGRHPAPVEPKREARTAGEAMTSPPITISGGERVDSAASLMLDRSVNRLPVVDIAGKLVGIVTRADLVRAFASSDERVEREIREEVLLRELWLDPREFEVTIADGAVELAGPFESPEQRDVAARRLRLVPGVVSVAIRETSPAR